MKGAAASLIVLALATSAAARTPAEMRTARAMERASASTPQLRVFLQAMPKGGDLHNHGIGTVYAEDVIAWADALGMCIGNLDNHLSEPPCTADQQPLHGIATRDYPRYSRLIDTISLRGYEQGVGDPEIPGFDRFFFSIDDTGAPRDAAKSFANARQAAAYDSVQYLELMTGGGKGQAEIVQAALASARDGSDFDGLYRAILPVLPHAVAQTRTEYDGYAAEGDALLGCGTGHASPACDVVVRYLNVAFRTRAPAAVFASLAFGFALAKADPRFVGVNIVGPEHHPVALHDYELHMQMIAYLKRLYPTVPISLHAGELTLGQVPPRDLRFHIAQAVRVAGARRIGHGIDISYEADASSLLRQMARDHVAVEINLTSNAIILGVKGRNHPLALYRGAGVPVVLSTDDEGVSRGDMTNEYVRAVQEQGLKYPALKSIVRNSLEYAFLPGRSLWQADMGGARVAACGTIRDQPTATCARFLATSQRATQQYKLEQSLTAFERNHH